MIRWCSCMQHRSVLTTRKPGINHWKALKYIWHQLLWPLASQTVVKRHFHAASAEVWLTDRARQTPHRHFIQWTVSHCNVWCKEGCGRPNGSRRDLQGCGGIPTLLTFWIKQREKNHWLFMKISPLANENNWSQICWNPPWKDVKLGSEWKSRVEGTETWFPLHAAASDVNWSQRSSEGFERWSGPTWLRVLTPVHSNDALM